ncbi:MAG: helix-turn-helix transcriptional regulator [Rhodocyclaceae bacterium]|nr:helix-turn-helix transcriptional regulator [Rhodocyclaceae bacterium]
MTSRHLGQSSPNIVVKRKPSRARKQSGAWSALDFEQEAFRATAEHTEFKRFARNGVRQFLARAGGAGTADVVRFADNDVILTVVNCVLPASASWRYDNDEPLIVLRASLCCDVTFQVEGAAPMIFNRPEVTLACVPGGRMQVVDIVGGVRQQGIIAVFRASTFAARYDLRVEDLPAVMREVLAASGAAGRIASFPLNHRIAGLIADTIDSPLESELRVVQYAGRLAELVAFTLDAMHHTPSLRGGALNRHRDVELANSALERLARDYRKPPCFVKLARDIGTNQNKLKAVFRDVFGVTMTEYCLERRMREAQQLLLQAKLTIAQVAERVGYKHQSSFAAAFCSHVGMSPRDYRQHRAPFSLPLGPIPARM